MKTYIILSINEEEARKGKGVVLSKSYMQATNRADVAKAFEKVEGILDIYTLSNVA